MLAYSKTGGHYASDPQCMWPILFFFILTVTIVSIYLVDSYDILKIMTPLVIVLGGFIAFNFNYLPVSSTTNQINPRTAQEVDNYIINQIVQADKKGKNKVTVKVPFDNKNANPKIGASNWPHSYDMAMWMRNTLYAHRIVRTRMKIVFKPSKEVNKRYYENHKNEQPYVPLE